jgi:hypothetical protein
VVYTRSIELQQNTTVDEGGQTTQSVDRVERENATVAFTMQVYAHVIPGMQADAAKAFGELVSTKTTPLTEMPTTLTPNDVQAAGSTRSVADTRIVGFTGGTSATRFR